MIFLHMLNMWFTDFFQLMADFKTRWKQISLDLPMCSCLRVNVNKGMVASTIYVYRRLLSLVA